MKTYIWIVTVWIGLAVTCSADAPFGLDNVKAMAQKLAASPYQDPNPPLPKEIDNLDYDAMRDIRFKDEYTLWQDKKLPFQVRFSQRSGYLRSKIDFFTIGPDGSPKEFAWKQDYFNFGRTKLEKPLPPNTGFGAFRLHYALNTSKYLDEAIVFTGPSYFRSLAKNQVYGLSCRGLAVNSGIVGVPEEFPLFTTFWLVQPNRAPLI